MKTPFVSAVILAAGESTRFGSGKQFLRIFGKTVIERSIAVFEAAPSYKEIIVVCREEDKAAIEKITANMKSRKLTKIVSGASTRSRSALNGAVSVNKKCEYIAIHDGARALLTVEMAERVAADAIRHGAAILSVPVTDTIKVSSEGFVKTTPERDKLYAAQTPQVFNYNEYCFALKEALTGAIEPTDDSQVFERLKKKVYLSLGDRDNIKITYPEDVELARNILRRRGETI